MTLQPLSRRARANSRLMPLGGEFLAVSAQRSRPNLEFINCHLWQRRGMKKKISFCGYIV